MSNIKSTEVGAFQDMLYQQLVAWKYVFFFLAGALIGVALFGRPGWMIKHINLALLGFGVIITAIAYYGTVICHELYEINDQLAGRSPELKNWLSNRGDREA